MFNRVFVGLMVDATCGFRVPCRVDIIYLGLGFTSGGWVVDLGLSCFGMHLVVSWDGRFWGVGCVCVLMLLGLEGWYLQSILCLLYDEVFVGCVLFLWVVWGFDWWLRV